MNRNLIEQDINTNNITFQDLVTFGDKLDNFTIITPQNIATFTDSQRHAVAIAVQEVMEARYGNAHKDQSLSDPFALAEKIKRADFQDHPGQQSMYVWLVGTELQPGFVTTVTDLGNGGAKLAKSAKSSLKGFSQLRGGQIMRKRVPFILEQLPHISHFFVDSRAANIASVAASAKSPHLVPCGLETKHYSLLEDGARLVQDGSVVMIGLRSPENIPLTDLYIGENTHSAKFIESVTDLMHAKWKIKPFTINRINTSELTENSQAFTDDVLRVRTGNYTSVRIADQVSLPSSEIKDIIQQSEADIFSQEARYLTFDMNVSNPSAVLWQIELESLGYAPARFWPPLKQDDPALLRYGKLHPSKVPEVFEFNFPDKSISFPYPDETSAVFCVLRSSADILSAGKQLVKEAFI